MPLGGGSYHRLGGGAGGGSASSPEYLAARPSAAQANPAVDDKILFATLDAAAGLSLDDDDATMLGFVSGEIYALEAQTRITNASAGAFLGMRFHDGTAYFGPVAQARALNDGNSVGNGPICRAIFAPTGEGPFSVQFRVSTKSGTADIASQPTHLFVTRIS